MPTGLFDVADRAPVFTPHEIEAGRQQCLASDTHLARFVQILNARWQRACRTAQLIETIRQGWCSIEPNTSPPSSDTRH